MTRECTGKFLRQKSLKELAMIKNEFFSPKNDENQEKSRVNVISNIIANSTGKNAPHVIWEEIKNLHVKIQTLEEEVRTLKSLLQNKSDSLPENVQGWAIKNGANSIYATKKIKNKHHRVYICKNTKLFSVERAQEKIENYKKKHKISS